MIKTKLIEPPLNFTGSKFKLLEQLLPLFDYTKPTFVDVFTGGGSVYCNVLDKYDRIIVNDIITDLINIHKGLMDSNDIIELTKTLCPAKDNQIEFLDLRENYNNEPTSYKLWALMLSCTNNMMRFSGGKNGKKFKFNQTFGKRTWSENTSIKAENYSEHIRNFKDKVKYISKNFHEVPVVKNTMYYLDPPYSNTEAGYNSYWNGDLYLYDYIKSIDNIGSSFALSGVLTHDNNTSDLLLKLIKDGYKYHKLNFDYNKVSRKGDKDTEEILIVNY